MRTNADRTLRVVSTVALVVVLSLLSAKYFGFTLDDSFISLRYADHLAGGEGLVWNVGGDPVEGYTSTLWVLVGGAVARAGLPLVETMKLVGVVATVGTVGVLWRFADDLDVPVEWYTPVVAAVAVSPAITVLSVQGMETTLAMALVTLGAVGVVRLVDQYSHRRAVATCGVLFLGMLTRPGLVVFTGVALGLVLLRYLRTDRRTEARALFAVGVALLFVPGVVFVAARLSYFGYLLPNPFYVKDGSSLVNLRGLFKVGDFATTAVGPVVVAVLGAVVFGTETDHSTPLRRTAPLFGGVGAFLAIWPFIRPVQGFFWRFQVPVLGAILVGLLVFARELPPSLRLDRRVGRHLLTVVLLALVVGAPMHTYFDARELTQNKTNVDRAAVGQSLGDLDGEGYRLFTSESGALPYYSGWRSIDFKGLNNETIAHDGLSPGVIERFDPDVIGVIMNPEPRYFQEKSPVLTTVLTTGEYRLVFVTDKGKASAYHAYFVSTSSPGYREISCTLLESEGVTAVSPEAVVDLVSIDVEASDIDRSDCVSESTSHPRSPATIPAPVV